MNDIILSPSSINLFLSCPYAFYLRYINKQKPLIEDDTALKLGKSTHKLLEKFYGNIDRSTTDPDMSLMDAMRRTALDHWDRTIDAKKRGEMDSYIMLWLQFEIQRFKKYKELNILNRFFPISSEEDITDWQNKIRAIIDKRCLGQSGNMYALDYKTDKKLPPMRNFKGDINQIDDKYKIQSALNALVLQSQGVKLDNFFFQFIRYPDKLLSVPLTPELFVEVKELMKKIRETTTFTKNTKSCFLCQMKLFCKTEDTCSHCITNDVL